MRKKTPAPSKRPPKAKDFDPYWGVCPTCKRNDGFYLDIGRSNWFYCAAHQVRWCIGDLFSSWRHQTEADFRRNFDLIGHFKCIAPERIEGAE